MSAALNMRAEKLLRLLVDRFIKDGQPVSSKTLADDGQLGLSPATIRNVLAELEEHGYLRSLHTSSGRVPTGLGYRMFVDKLVAIQPLDDATVASVQATIDPNQPTTQLMSQALNLVSHLTHMAGLITLPRVESKSLEHIEFLPLARRRVLVILVFNDKEVENRIININHDYSRNELLKVSNYFNKHYAGRDLQKVQAELLTALKSERAALDAELQAMLAVLKEALNAKESSHDYLLTGEYNLLSDTDDMSIKKIKQLFTALTQKQQLLYLLEQCGATGGVQIFIGEEAGYDIFNEYSLVTSTYSTNNQVLGVIGVIGPSRMPYDKIIPIVDISAKLLSQAITE